MKSLSRLSSSVFYRTVEMLFVCIALFVLSFATAGQTPSPNHAEEMRKLDFLVGEWKGEGWELRPGWSKRYKFLQKTKVKATESNSTLRIKDERRYLGKPFSHTSSLDAVISYNAEIKLYQWGDKDSKNGLEVKLLSDKTLQFGMPFTVTLQPLDGYRKTTIKVTEGGEWHETLEIWEQGKWYIVEESILKRVK